MQNETQTKITIRDVAKRAGVSCATVSRVLNKLDRVSEETRQRVNAAIEELSFTRSSVAASMITGKTKTELDRISTTAESKYDAKIIYLCFNSRELLYERINRRVDIMLENGLEDEVRRLYESGALCGDTTAGQAIGYKEMLKYIDGQITLSEATDEIKQNSRRYAKRQLTWFGAKENFYRLYVDDEKGVRELCDIANEAENYLI